MLTLVLFFARLTYCQDRNAFNFNDFQLLRQESSQTSVYLSFHAGTTATIERYLNTYVFIMLENEKDISLKIVKDGLKNTYRKIIVAYKKRV